MCVLVLAVHSNCQPYVRARVNYTESVYLVVLCTLAIMQIVQDIKVKYYVCLVLLVIVGIHALVVTVYKATRFFRKRFDCACARACARTEALERRHGYDVLENTEIERSLDAERERQRNILDTIYTLSGEGSEHGQW